MSINKQKLELTWIGKDKRPRLEPRIFLEDKSLSYQAQVAHSKDDVIFSAEQQREIFNDNLLIHADNLLALKALEQKYTGKIRCIYIDPPFNTHQAFEQYDDGLEHSMWLSMLRNRVEILSSLLTEDGSIWIHLDDNEMHYFKVMMDEIMGRKNFVSSIVWQKVFAKKNKALISSSHDTILVYAKNIDKWHRNLLGRTESQLKSFKNPDNDYRGPWQSVAYSVKSESSEKRKAYRYAITTPSGREVYPPTGRHWNGLEDRTSALIQDNRIWFGPDGNNPPRLKVFLSEVQDGVVPDTWWNHESSGNNQEAKKEVISLVHGVEPFGTPKPERLLERIIAIASNPGDLVLDSFAGSGTTGAVAHKMGRRWIMVELGEHCQTHIVPRLKKIIDGEDQGGISKTVNWQGGGGFRYLRLAPSLLKKDSWGQWIINQDYNAEMLAEAMCKHMGFTYARSQTQFWNHGYSTETDHIYVTTGSLAYDQLKRISEEVGTERTLLICCKAFMAEGADLPNLTLKKIPKVILNKCEWDHDDYSFNLNVLPEEHVDDLEEDGDNEE